MDQYKSLSRFVVSYVIGFIKGNLVRFIVFAVPLTVSASVFASSFAVMVSAGTVASVYKRYYYSDFAWLPVEEATAAQKEYDLDYTMKEIQTAENHSRAGRSLAAVSAFIYAALAIYASVNIVNANDESAGILRSLGFSRKSLIAVIILQIVVLLLFAVITASLAAIAVSSHFLNDCRISLKISDIMKSAAALTALTVISALPPVFFAARRINEHTFL